MDIRGITQLQERMASFNPPRIQPMKMPDIRNYQLADYQYEVLMRRISSFQESLDPDLEVAANLASFGQNILVHITSLGYSNPSLIHIYGQLENGSDVELIQHVSQINFLLVAAKRIDDSKPARRIGFLSESEASPD